MIYNVAIIREAVKKLPMSLRDANPTAPWKRIAGTRDIVIHDYGIEAIPIIRVMVRRNLAALRKTI